MNHISEVKTHVPGQASFNKQAEILAARTESSEDSFKHAQITDCAPDPFNGMTIVTATCSAEVNNRVPIVIQAIQTLGKGLASDDAVPLNLIIAEWGRGLNEDDRRAIAVAARAAGIPVDFTPVTPDFKSAGHSFNEGLRAIPRYPGKTSQWVMKLDDDSIAPHDLPARLAAMVHRTDADLIAGWDVRTKLSDNLADPEQVRAILEQEERRCAAIPESVRSNDVAAVMMHRGAFSLAKLYTTYSFGLTNDDPICPNENGLLVSPNVINKFSSYGKGLFIPEFPSGEGAALFALLTALSKEKIVIDRKAFVLDRPAGGFAQEYTWGRGDAEFALTLKRAKILPSGLDIARVNSESGKVELLHVPSERTGTIIYPENLELILKAAEADSEGFFREASPVDRERAERGLAKLKEWMPLVRQALASPEIRVEHTFNSLPPRYSLEDPHQLFAMLLHIAGGVATFEHYGDNDIILARGAL